jgi:hypothetical protein
MMGASSFAIVVSPESRLDPPERNQAAGEFDVARWCREAPRGLDHFLLESNAFQRDRAGAGIGDAKR